MCQTIHLLIEDKRWTNLRVHLVKPEQIGERMTTLIFGIIISLICPVVIIFQTQMFGVVMNSYRFKKGCVTKILLHVFKQVRFQNLIITDSNLLRYDDNKRLSIWKVILLALSYVVYMLPVVGLFFAYYFAWSNSTVCHPLAAPFLLDNNISPANNISFLKLYEKRKEQAERSKLLWDTKLPG